MTITDLARQILRQPQPERRALIEQHDDPEALKAEVLRLWTKHRAFLVSADGRRFPMIPSEPMTLDEALEHARRQFGAGRVEGVEAMQKTHKQERSDNDGSI